MELLNELRNHLRNTPIEELRKEWEEIQAMNLGGPTVTEFVDHLKEFYCPILKIPESWIKTHLELTPEFSGSFFFD